MVGDLTGKAHLVRHDQHGAAFLGQHLHHAQHFAYQLGVKGRGGLVKQHHLGLYRQCAGNGHALLLAAAHVVGVAVFLALQAHQFEVLAGTGHGLVLAQAQHMHGHFDDVLHHRHMRPKVEVLEHHGQLAAQALELLGVHRVQRAVAVGAQLQAFASYDDLPLLRLLQKVDAAQKGALARARAADDADHVASAGVERDALEHLVAAIALVDVQRLQFVVGCVHISMLKCLRPCAVPDSPGNGALPGGRCQSG